MFPYAPDGPVDEKSAPCGVFLRISTARDWAVKKLLLIGVRCRLDGL
jgi:hypothetical protein